MNEKDKQAVNRQQQSAKAKRTNVKSQPKSDGQTDNGQQGNSLQQALQERSQQAGLQLADNFQAATLMYAMQFIQQGEYGEKTTQLLEAFTNGGFSPLDDWTLVLEPATSEVGSLPALLESNGSSTSPWLESPQEESPVVETTA